jgi:tetratricopeptide (TPR) repeat protein
VRRAFLLMLLVGGCGGAAPERAGDRAYGASRFDEAVAAYRHAVAQGASARLWAKLGAAALHAGELRTSAEAWRRVAGDDPTRVDEAADGLELVAREADRNGDAQALEDAVLGLRAAAPERFIGRYALALTRRSTLSEVESLALLPAAMAAAPDAETVDSLLAAYASALQASGGCGQAAPAYRAALRRTRSGTVRTQAGGALATCALSLGLAALGGGHAAEAERWLVQAVRVDSVSWVGRRALIALGDARVGQGDILAAAIAYQSVVDVGATDSLGRLARERLNGLGGGEVTADTGRRRMP